VFIREIRTIRVLFFYSGISKPPFAVTPPERMDALAASSPAWARDGKSPARKSAKADLPAALFPAGDELILEWGRRGAYCTMAAGFLELTRD
jgi:hypothetical protein